MNKQKISDVIYEHLNYMYCDNCRYNSEQTDSDACEDCHRKYNGWAISRNVADSLADKILDMKD